MLAQTCTGPNRSHNVGLPISTLALWYWWSADKRQCWWRWRWSWKIAPQSVVGPCRPGWHDLTLGENALAVRQTPEPDDDDYLDAYYGDRVHYYHYNKFYSILPFWVTFLNLMAILNDVWLERMSPQQNWGNWTNLKCQLKPLWISESHTQPVQSKKYICYTLKLRNWVRGWAKKSGLSNIEDIVN